MITWDESETSLKEGQSASANLSCPAGAKPSIKVFDLRKCRKQKKKRSLLSFNFLVGNTHLFCLQRVKIALAVRNLWTRVLFILFNSS